MGDDFPTSTKAFIKITKRISNNSQNDNEQYSTCQFIDKTTIPVFQNKQFYSKKWLYLVLWSRFYHYFCCEFENKGLLC